MEPNTWAMLCHLGGLTGYFGNGLGSIIAPLALWIIKKDELPQVDYHGKEALNFNISVTLYFLGLGIATAASLGFGFILTGPLMALLAIFHLICTILAAIKANNGEEYRYPLCLRFIK